MRRFHNNYIRILSLSCDNHKVIVILLVEVITIPTCRSCRLYFYQTSSITGLQRIMLRDLSDVDRIRHPIYIVGVMCNGLSIEWDML